MQPLEDVRNDNSIPYIKKLRGIPNDATETVKEKLKTLTKQSKRQQSLLKNCTSTY